MQAGASPLPCLQEGLWGPKLEYKELKAQPDMAKSLLSLAPRNSLLNQETLCPEIGPSLVCCSGAEAGWVPITYLSGPQDTGYTPLGRSP